MESAFRTRKTVRLKDRRISISGARYFVTLCVSDRTDPLVDPPIGSPLITQLEHQEEDGDFELLSGVLMPDHLHFVIRLGERISLSQSIAKFKAKTRRSVSWQENFYEHRIRSDETEENYAFYVFMNPYADNLCELSDRWLWWRRWKNVPYDFEELLDPGDPIPAEWLKRRKGFEKRFRFNRRASARAMPQSPRRL